MGNQKSTPATWWEHQCTHPSSEKIDIMDLIKENERTPLSHDQLVERIIFLKDSSLLFFTQWYLYQQNLGALRNPTRSTICREVAELLFQYHDHSKGTLNDVLEKCTFDILLQKMTQLQDIKDETTFNEYYQELREFIQQYDQSHPNVITYLREGFQTERPLRQAMQAGQGSSLFRFSFQLLLSVQVETLMKWALQNKLRALELEEVGIDAIKLKIIADALAQNTTLLSLALDFNYFGDEGAVVISKALQNNHSRLIFLSLSGNEIGNEGIRAIAEALKTNTTLEGLEVHRNDIDAQGAQYMADALLHNTTLKKLTMFLNRLGSDGVQMIAQSLYTNTTLQDLDLTRTDCENMGALALGKALQHNASIQTLLLYGNYIDAEGIPEIAEALKQNTTLTRLGLSFNNIGSGIVQLAESLTKNRTLMILEAESNHIGDEDALQLKNLLQHNFTLTAMDLRHNNINTEMLESIYALFEEDQRLKRGKIRPLGSLVASQTDPFSHSRTLNDVLTYEAGNELLHRVMRNMIE